MEISTGFEGGSILVDDLAREDEIRLRLKPDNASDFNQWFFFRLTGVRDRALGLNITNADGANTAKGLVGMPQPWDDYRAYASHDLRRWFRLPTWFDGQTLRMEARPAHDQLYVAHFPPHTMARHRLLVARAAARPGVALEVLGRTPDGQDLDVLRVGEPGAGKRVCWLVARQHPSETQGSWCLEGLLARLLDPADGTAVWLRQRAVFYIMPNINPDGSRRGNTRSNALGQNLNRVWHMPTMDDAPEVVLVNRRMAETGCDFFLDAHAWSGTNNFAIGPYNVPAWPGRLERLWAGYDAALATATPEYRPGNPYPGGGPAPGQADPGMSWNHVGQAYNALAVLYELIAKDNEVLPDPELGWTADKCRRFGAATLDALRAVLPDLR